MPRVIPRTANEVIERLVDVRAKALMRSFNADVLGFCGPLIFEVDDFVKGVVEAVRRRSKAYRKLVIVLTTQGGYIEVVKRIVETLRYHYEFVEFVVPNNAFSAGTVLAMSGDAIHMNYYSRLGPIDPQVRTTRGLVVSALGYLEQWDRLLEKAKDGKLTTAEAQLMIDGFDQGELYEFEQARELSVTLLKEWLVKYKFKNWLATQARGLQVTPEMRAERAEEIARALNDTKRWRSHGYGISMEVLQKDLNLQIDDFDRKPEVAARIMDYHSLLNDYMGKRGDAGVLHTVGQYVPFTEEA